MGTKRRAKEQSSEADDQAKVEKKKKGRWLSRLVRKRKLRSQSEERLHDRDNVSQTDEHDLQPDVGMEASLRHQGQCDGVDDVLDESSLQEENDDGDVTEIDSKEGIAPEEKKKLFSSALKFLKFSVWNKKRKKHTDYAKFSDAAEEILEDQQQPCTSKDGMNDDDDDEILPENKEVQCSTDRVKGKKKSNKYVRFDTDNDDDKENIAMTIDENNRIDSDQNQSTPKKKKKSARKRVAKAGRKTGRMLGVGMVQIGKNLQYLSPMPTPHVFSDTASKASSYATSKSRKPKKQSYKYTASAPPPSNPYGFV